MRKRKTKNSMAALTLNKRTVVNLANQDMSRAAAGLMQEPDTITDCTVSENFNSCPTTQGIGITPGEIAVNIELG